MSFWRDMLGLPAEKVSKRTYAAATGGRLFADFFGSSRSADSELRPALATMRNRSRDMARNDPYVRRYLELLKTNVVGASGVSVQSKARNADNSMDAIGNAIVESAWATFGRKGNCTPDGRFSMTALQEHIVEATARDGEVFIQIVRNSALKHGIAFHPFEPDQIDEQKNEKAPNGNQIRMGIEVDRYQRPVAYWMKAKHPGDADFSAVGVNETRRLPAENIIHVFRPLRAGQSRGEPWTSVALAQIKMLNGYREAELVAARMAAAKMGFFVSDTGDGVPADDYDGRVPIIDAEPGTFHQLPAGVDFKQFDMNHPATAFADFEKGILRSTASGLNVSYVALSNDLEGVSYSSIRQGALEERDAYRGLQEWLIEYAVRPMFEAWLRHVMEFGIVTIPATKFDKFADAMSFRGRGWQWVDPQKEISAAVEAMNNGVMSPEDVVGQRGGDLEETYSQWQRAIELARSYGLELAYSPFGKDTPVAADQGAPSNV